MNDRFTLRLVRPAELAERLSVSRATLWRWERSGQLPKRRRLGSNVTGWSSQDLERWFASTEPPDATDPEKEGPEG